MGDSPAGFNERPSELAIERAVDEVLAESFPASDPPSWTLGVARSDPVRHVISHEPPIAGVVRREGDRSGLSAIVHGLVTLAGAVGIALLIPIAILILGLPVALGIRVLLEAVEWLASLIL